MQIKKYISLTLKDALDQLKNELGNDAVVLSTRVIPGEAGSGISKQYEVLAGIENNSEKKSAKPKLFDKIIDDNTGDAIEELKTLKDKVFPRSERFKKESTRMLFPENISEISSMLRIERLPKSLSMVR